MPLYAPETRKSGRLTAAGIAAAIAATAAGGLVLPRTPVIVIVVAATGAGTRTMFLLLTTAARLAVLVTAGIDRTVVVTGNPVAGGQLNLEFDDFVPLLVSPVAFRDGQQFAQATTIVGLLNGRSDRGIFWVWIIHC